MMSELVGGVHGSLGEDPMFAYESLPIGGKDGSLP